MSRAITSRELFNALVEVLDLPKDCISLELRLGVNEPVRIKLETYVRVNTADGALLIANVFRNYELQAKGDGHGTVDTSDLTSKSHRFEAGEKAA